MTLPNVERAYLAGIIDGEGCIMAGRRTEPNAHGGIREWFELRVNITNSDVRLLDWLEERFPENPRRILLQRSRTHPTHKPTWSWNACNRRAIPILIETLPYLVLKREQAEIAMELATTQRNNGRRGYPPDELAARRCLYDRLRVLNRKGVAA